jgi:hypothetical protein
MDLLNPTVMATDVSDSMAEILQSDSEADVSVSMAEILHSDSAQLAYSMCVVFTTND